MSHHVSFFKVWTVCCLTLCSSSCFGQHVAQVSKYPFLLVVSFDGFRYDLLNKTSTPYFDRLISNGVKAPWIQPRYISKTFPNHFSIATGLYEESHGIVANSFFDPVLNDTFEMEDTDAKWWDVGAMPLWILNQVTDSGRYSGGMMWPGTAAWIHNQTTHHVASYDRKVSWKDRVDTVILWMTDAETPANCVFLYFEEPDSSEHQYGPDSPEVVSAVERVDNITGYLVSKLQEAGLFDEVNLIITSDHGMTDVPKENVLFMTDFLNVTKFRYFGSSPVWSILPNPGLDEEVYQDFFISSQNLPFTVYKKEQIPESYHYRNNRRVMPLLVAVDEHYDLYVDRSAGVPNRTIGNHGYNNSLASMQALFVAHGPQFKKGFVSKPFENIDIFSLGCRILGLKAPSNNGTIDIVRSLLLNDTADNVDDIILVVILLLLSACIIVALCAVARLRRRAAKNRLDRDDIFGSCERRLRPNNSHNEDSPAFEESQRLLLPPQPSSSPSTRT